MKTIRIFILQTDVRKYRGNSPVRSKNKVYFPHRKSRLVSHPTNYLFAAPDSFDVIGLRSLFWYWNAVYQMPPALICDGGTLRVTAQMFMGNSPEFCKVTWETVRQRQFFLGDIVPWDDDHDIELEPFNENIPEDITQAQLLPAQVVKNFLDQSKHIDRAEFLHEAGYPCE